MKIVVLGSGTAEPHKIRSSAGYWVETEGGTILLDFGASVLHRLAQEDLNWFDLDAIWISHFHLDHCCGLPAYLFASRHSPKTRHRTKSLTIYGGKGLRDLISNFDRAGGGKLLQQRFPVRITEIEQLEKFEMLPEVKAIAISTPHTPDSNAIRITDIFGKSLVYTSDTGFGKPLAAFAGKADLLIIESSYVREKQTDIHLELAEAMYIIKKARPRRAMLTHLYADWDTVDLASEVSKFDPVCEVVEAVDGLRLTI